MSQWAVKLSASARKCSLKWIDASRIGVNWELIPDFHDAVGEEKHLRTLDSPRSKRCGGEFIILRQGVSL